MKIKDIRTLCRKSANYQSFEFGETITLEPTDDVEVVRRESQARCRKAVMEQIELEKRK